VPKYEVRHWVDVYHMQRCTSTFASGLGFSKRECSELAIVVSELTSNILKYGVHGSIEIESVSEDTRCGITLIANDCGPPFRDLQNAMRDGYDDSGPIDPLLMLNRKGIGGGLGAIMRLTDSFHVEPVPNGKRVVVTRFLAKSHARRV
jgi:anti-sigma regulatory factor (Ser/Thr protein kinase)